MMNAKHFKRYHCSSRERHLCLESDKVWNKGLELSCTHLVFTSCFAIACQILALQFWISQINDKFHISSKSVLKYGSLQMGFMKIESHSPKWVFMVSRSSFKGDFLVIIYASEHIFVKFQLVSNFFQGLGIFFFSSRTRLAVFFQ